MLGIIVQLALSWLIIWLVEKKDLGVLGLFPTKQRLLDFFLFLLITALCCSSGFLMKMLFAKQQWKLNPDFSFNLVLNGLWWNIKSVLFEELIFRGVLLYILIKRVGFSQGIIISAIAFGIYHWFSFGVIGNVTQMAITFVITGTMGLVYAYGYAKTLSLYVPSAIHLGWNFTQNFVFSQGPIGNGIFVTDTKHIEVSSYFIFLCIQLLPIMSAMVINYLLLKRRKRIAV